MYFPISGTGVQTIRLLELAAARRHDPVVRIALHVFKLDEAPAYDAVSYVWGEPGGPRVEIACNGAPFSVTANLYWALRRARLEDGGRLLWADAICINQQDLGERSEQVGFMGRIYGQARMVLICMGEPPDERGGENVLRVLREAVGRGVSISTNAEGPGPLLRDGDSLKVAPGWWSVSVLMRQPWFRRSWVLQEAGLARLPMVLYGDVEFEYRALVAVLLWVRRQKWSAKFNIPVLNIHTGWLDWSNEGWRRQQQAGVHGLLEPTLFDLLDHAALLSCSDPVDHVYAFLGHPVAQQADGSGPVIWPDYTKDVLEVYRDVMELLLSKVGGRTLVTVEHTEETMADEAVPSWVNRWYIHDVINNISQLPAQMYCAGGLAGRWRPPLVNGACLVVDGVGVDVVMRCFRIRVLPGPLPRLVFNDVEEREFSLEEVAEYVANAQLSPSRYGDDRLEREKRLVRVLCTLRLDERGAAENSHLSDFRHYVELERHIRTAGNRQNVAAGDPRVEAALALWQRMSGMCQGRGLVITRTGYCGLGPRIARQGDRIYVLHGLDVPFLLRMGARGVRLVGESYVEGLMGGEAFEMVQRGELREESLLIC